MIYEYIRYLLIIPMFVILVAAIPLLALLTAKNSSEYVAELKYGYKMLKRDLL